MEKSIHWGEQVYKDSTEPRFFFFFLPQIGCFCIMFWSHVEPDREVDTKKSLLPPFKILKNAGGVFATYTKL